MLRSCFRMETIFEICHTTNITLDVTVNLLVKRIYEGKRKKKFPKERFTYFPSKHMPSDLARLKLPPYAGRPLN